MSEVEDFISKNNAWLIRNANKFVRNADAAMDLVQDAIVKMLRHKDSFEEGTNIKGWAYLIMKNTFFDHCKKGKKTAYKMIGTEGTGVDMYFSELNGGESKIRVDEIHSYINNLKETHRELFTLYINGFKYKELAEIFNIPLGTVKARIFDVRRILKDRIEKSNKIKKTKTKK